MFRHLKYNILNGKMAPTKLSTKMCYLSQNTEKLLDSFLSFKVHKRIILNLLNALKSSFTMAWQMDTVANCIISAGATSNDESDDLMGAN